MMIILLGIYLTLVVSKILSKTILKGIPSSFILELPPYRKPQFAKVVVRSILDRTIFVLGRAISVSVPAGALIWLLQNITVADGTAPAKINLAYQNIKVKEGKPNPVPPEPDDDQNTNTNTNTNTDGNINISGNTSIEGGNKTNTNKNVTTNTVNKDAMNKGKLPKAGETTTMIFMILIAMIVLVAGIFFIKIKIINKEIDKQ